MKHKKVVVKYKRIIKKVKVKRTVWTVEPVYGKIGKRIADFRKMRGMRQEDLAAKIGVSRASIANMEAGRQRIMLHQIITMAKGMETGTDNLLRGAL